MNQNEDKRLSVKKLFIENAAKVIARDGLENITIRKVAQDTGYNSATLYSYFDNLDHLIFLASLTHLTEYTDAIESYTAAVSDPLLKAMKVWECFIHFSFQNPKVYYALFFNKREKDLNRYLTEYKKIFRHDPLPTVVGVSSTSGIHDRSDKILAEAVAQKEIDPDHIPELNEMMMYIYQGLLSQMIYDPFLKREILEARFLKYMVRIFESYAALDVRTKIRSFQPKREVSEK